MPTAITAPNADLSPDRRAALRVRAMLRPCSQKFAESLLEVADNLESAARAVPQDVLREGAEVPADTSLKYLKALLEGVQATERVLLKVGAAAAGGRCAEQRSAQAMHS